MQHHKGCHFGLLLEVAYPHKKRSLRTVRHFLIDLPLGMQFKMLRVATKVSKLNPESAQPLSKKAYFLIRERILRGELRPGQVLSGRTLAEEFDMSLLPVSEALRQLENDKLVESRPRAGTRVRIPQREEVRGRCIVREALEAQSARLCCAQATMKERVELLRAARQLDILYERLGRDGDSDLQYVVHAHHFDLHMRIAEYAHCQELKEAIEMNQVLIYNWFFDLAANRRLLPSGFHTRLLQTVTGSDPLLADKAMRAHVQYGVAETLRLIVPQTPQDWRLRRSTDESKTPVVPPKLRNK
jgi:DNA-binding GntR family transcriptional regulator